MKRPLRALSSIFVLATLPCAAAAQQPGLPVDHSPAHLPVTGVHLDFGQGSGFAGTGRLRSFGGRLHHAFGGLQLMAGVHRVSTDREGLEDGYGAQASLAFRVLEPRPRRVANVQAGVGWARLDDTAGGGGVTLVDVPLSVSLGAYLPTPLGPAEAWVAPRAHVRHVSRTAVGVEDDGTSIGPGGSVGLRFTLADAQAGFSIALDGMTLRDPVEDEWRFLGAFQLALHLLLLR